MAARPTTSARLVASAVDGVDVQLVYQAVELAVQGSVVDRRHNVHFVGGKQPAQAVHRVGGFYAGRRHGRLEVDAEAGFCRDELGALLPRLDLDGLICNAAKLRLELIAGLLRCHRTDVDTAHVRATGHVSAVHCQIGQVQRESHGKDAEECAEGDLASAAHHSSTAGGAAGAALLMRGCLHRSHPSHSNGDL